MDGYAQVTLLNLIRGLEDGENGAKKLLSTFSCPHNFDVEQFLKTKAIEFSKQGWAESHLVFADYKGELVLVGYFALTAKAICVYRKNLSNTLAKKVSKFGTYDKYSHGYVIPAPLIAQLGKNFANDYDKLITGDELLKLALEKVAMTQQFIGGKIAYVECEDKHALLSFYKRNGFVEFGERPLDRDERSKMDGTRLIQLLRIKKNDDLGGPI